MTKTEHRATEPLMGWGEHEVGLLGLPLPDPEPGPWDIFLQLLEAGGARERAADAAQTMAGQGRGGDTVVGHLTPGELVIPERLQTKAVMAALRQAAAAAGVPEERLRVGSGGNRINPKTGAPEFDDGDDDSGPADDLGVADPGASSDADDLGVPQAGAGEDPGVPVVTPDPMEEVTITASPDPQPDPHFYPYLRQAETVYGETGSVRPQLIDPTKSADDPSNWDPDSARKLAEGRAGVAAVYPRNPGVYLNRPTDFMNPIQMREWESALTAAQTADAPGYELDPHIKSFYFRQEGKPVKDAPTYDAISSIGPFRKHGPGDVPNGDATYFDFYNRQLPRNRQ